MPWAAWASVSCRSACDLGNPGLLRASEPLSHDIDPRGSAITLPSRKGGADPWLELLLSHRLWPKAPGSPAYSTHLSHHNPPSMVLPFLLQGEPGKAGEKGLPGAPGLRVSNLPPCPRAGASWTCTEGAAAPGLLPESSSAGGFLWQHPYSSGPFGSPHKETSGYSWSEAQG